VDRDRARKELAKEFDALAEKYWAKKRPHAPSSITTRRPEHANVSDEVLNGYKPCINSAPEERFDCENAVVHVTVREGNRRKGTIVINDEHFAFDYTAE
jgi:hypothetical protein